MVRAAGPDDAAAVAAVHHGSWVETYSGLLAASHWESDTLERRTDRWRQALADGVPLTVASIGGRVVGIPPTVPARSTRTLGIVEVRRVR